MTAKAPKTVAELVEAYIAYYRLGWKPATEVAVRKRAQLICVAARGIPRFTDASDVDELVARHLHFGHAPNQIRQTVALWRALARFGHAKGWLPDHLDDYRPRLPKGERAAEPPDFSPDDVAAFTAVEPTATNWRAWVGVQLAAWHGCRSESLRHLAWEDIRSDFLEGVDFGNGAMTWSARWMKQSTTLIHPILPQTRRALDVAMTFGHTLESPWVLPAARNPREPVSYAVLDEMLRAFEEKAGVLRFAGRSWHGFRRHAFNEVFARTKDVFAACAWIGDTPDRGLVYLRRQDARIRDAAVALARAGVAP